MALKPSEFLVGHRKQSGVNRDFTAGQRKRVSLIGANHVELPLKTRIETFGTRGLNQFPANRSYLLNQVTVLHNVTLAEYVLIRLQTKRHLLITGNINKLGTPG